MTISAAQAARDAMTTATSQAVQLVQSVPPIWITYLSALLAPAIAGLAVAVAVAQWRIARNKLKLDLFDRRYSVYVAAQDAMTLVVMHGGLDRKQQRVYLNGVRGTRWLFDERVFKYLEGVWERIIELENYDAIIKDAQFKNIPHGVATKKRAEHKKWFAEQLTKRELDDVFGPFLQLEH